MVDKKTNEASYIAIPRIKPLICAVTFTSENAAFKMLQVVVQGPVVR